MAQRSGFRIVVVLVLLLIGLLFVIPMLAMFMWGPMMMGGMMGGWGYPAGAGWGYPAAMGWGLMLAGMLAPLIFIVFVIVGAYFLLTPRDETAGSERALTILDERYAKGEITKEQYVEMKQHLTKK